MADEKQLLSGIDWQETFGFTNLFRGFRLAIHPGKLVLAFAGLALCLIAGLVLDKLWYSGPPIIWENGQPVEVQVFADGGQGSRDFPAWYDRQAEEREEMLKRLRDKEFDLDPDEANIGSAGVITHFINALQEDLDEFLEENDLAKKEKEIKEKYKDLPDKKKKLLAEARKDIPEKCLAECRQTQQKIEAVKDLVGKGPADRGPFRALVDYERGVFQNLISAALHLNFAGGMDLGPVARDAEPGVAKQICNGLKGLQWLLWRHPIFFAVFGVISLAIWGLAGGAISRIAALHIARDEKISMQEALKFSIRKFPSFVFAPLIPLGIIALFGVIMWAGTLVLCNIPGGVGAFLNSVLFFLPLIAGLVIALIGVGTVGGINLMFPTIAVEGSDSFDAISRSFSYIYARPWRMGFYSLISLVYGVLCYLFVRFFAFLVLKVTHIAVDLGVRVDGSSGLVSRFKTMWPGPTVGDLHGGYDWGAAAGIERFGAVVIAFWVYIVIGFVAAFVVSFFFSANTIIYGLLRKKVDATDIDDVYVEEEPAEEIPPVAEAPAEAPPEPEKPQDDEPEKGEETSQDEGEEKTE